MAMNLIFKFLVSDFTGNERPVYFIIFSKRIIDLFSILNSLCKSSNIKSVINLDYPGLEKAKEFYNSGKYYYAVNELLEYYRNRTSVINPNIQLMNTPITASELNIADQALENRFYVRGFAERVEDGKEIYYSFTA